MALIQVNFVSRCLMRTVPIQVILPVDQHPLDKTLKEKKPFKTLYLLHGIFGNHTDWVTNTRIQKWAEEKNLKPDYYMASLYNLSQPDRSQDVNPTGERFEESDIPKMYAVIRELSAPTIALKILGAGRRCADQAQVQAAFREAFASMKPGDGVLVGMFDKYIDQPRLNAEYTLDAIRSAGERL